MRAVRFRLLMIAVLAATIPFTVAGSQDQPPGGAPSGSQPTPKPFEFQREPNPDAIYANFPMLLELRIYNEILPFRANVEQRIRVAGPRLGTASGVVGLIDSLVTEWDRFGRYLEREHGDFPNMRRDRPYWLLITDDAADTLTDRLGPVLERFVKANPDEKLGEARAQWEIGAENLGSPRSKIFGFQMVELARRARLLRESLLQKRPADAAVIEDANIRFLWDLQQFYRQLHGSWYDRHSMRVAEEDWIVYRTKGICKDPKWQVALSLTAIGVDTSNTDYMSDKFMHRIMVTEPACNETVDFVIPLPHYRLMERELNNMSEEQKQEIIERVQKSVKPAPPAGGQQNRSR
jgi:hypothetical protein